MPWDLAHMYSPQDWIIVLSKLCRLTCFALSCQKALLQDSRLVCDTLSHMTLHVQIRCNSTMPVWTFSFAMCRSPSEIEKLPFCSGELSYRWWHRWASGQHFPPPGVSFQFCRPQWCIAKQWPLLRWHKTQLQAGRKSCMRWEEGPELIDKSSSTALS